MTNDSLARLGASVIADSINYYDTTPTKIVTADDILNMEPVIFSQDKNPDGCVVYAVNHSSSTILVRFSDHTKELQRKVIKWYNPSQDTPTRLLEIIASKMDDDLISEFWLYPDKIVEKTKHNSEYINTFDSIPLQLLEKLHKILKQMLKDVKIDDYNSKEPCIHITKTI